jgi:diphthamide biosynthesis protein 4
MPHQMLINSSPEDRPNHYQVLDIPWTVGTGLELSAQHLKAAYRRALLRHHPDKTQAQSDSVHSREDCKNVKGESTYTVDRLTEAYATLSVPELRAEYDRVLKLLARPMNGTGQGGYQAFHSGLETVDLDDLGYDEEGGVWYKSCRCGDERGYQIRETDLEETSDLGELHVGCRGCSLWLRVLFGVVEGRVEDRDTDRV